LHGKVQWTGGKSRQKTESGEQAELSVSMIPCGVGHLGIHAHPGGRGQVGRKLAGREGGRERGGELQGLRSGNLPALKQKMCSRIKIKSWTRKPGGNSRENEDPGMCWKGPSYSYHRQCSISRKILTDDKGGGVNRGGTSRGGWGV